MVNINNLSSNIFPSTLGLEKMGADVVSSLSLSSAKPDKIFWKIFEATLFR
jgi:hypothetical protein